MKDSNSSLRDTLQALTDDAAKRDMNSVFAKAMLALNLTPSGRLTASEYTQVMDYIRTQPDLMQQFEHASKAHSPQEAPPIVAQKVSLREIFDPDDFEFVTEVLESSLPPLSLMRAQPRHDPVQRSIPKAPVQKNSRRSQPNRHTQPNPRTRQA